MKEKTLLILSIGALVGLGGAAIAILIGAERSYLVPAIVGAIAGIIAVFVINSRLHMAGKERSGSKTRL